MEQLYTCTRDRTVLAMTVFVIVVMVGISGMHLYLSLRYPKPFFLVVVVLVSLFSMGIIIGSYLYAPRSFSITPEYITVRRLGPDVTISIERIGTVRAGTHEDFTGLVRTFGNGGVFGYTGWFRSKKLGDFRAFMTRKDSTVIIEMRDRSKFVLSPDDPNGFLELVNQQLEALRSDERKIEQ